MDESIPLKFGWSEVANVSNNVTLRCYYGSAVGSELGLW